MFSSLKIRITDTRGRETDMDISKIGSAVDFRIGLGQAHCCYEGCSNEVFAVSYCRKHYDSTRTSALKNLRLSPKERARCAFADCKFLAAKRGYCRKHVRAVFSRGRANRPCSVKACERLVHARGLCRAHYRRETYATGASTGHDKRRQKKRQLLK